MRVAKARSSRRISAINLNKILFIHCNILKRTERSRTLPPVTFPHRAVVLALMLLNAPLPSLPAKLAGEAMTQLCSGVPALLLLLVLGLPPLPGVDGIGGGTSCLLF